MSEPNAEIPHEAVEKKRNDFPLIAGLAALGLAELGIGALAWKAVQAQPQQILVQASTPPPPPQTILVPISSPVPEVSVSSTPLPLPSGSGLPKYIPLTSTPLVNVLVPQGTVKTIYDVQIPQIYMGVVTDLGNNMYVPTDPNGNQLFYYDFLIDGERVEKVERIIANVNSPFRPPLGYMATRSVQWICHNNTTQDLRAIVYCFPKSTRVLGSNQLINSLNPDNTVLSSKGTEQPIQNCFSRLYSGPLVQIKACGLPQVEMTPEHKVFTTSKWSTEWLRSERKMRYEPLNSSWKSASELTTDDWVATPRRKSACRKATMKITVGGKRFGKRRTIELEITPRIARVLGLWVAEGHLANHDCLAVYELGPTESKIAHYIGEVWENLFVPASCAFVKNKARGCMRVYLSCKSLASFLVENFGRGARNKRIPNWVKDERLEIRRAFLAGYWLGDGHMAKNGVSSFVMGIKTSSQTLAYDVMELLSSLHIASSYILVPEDKEKKSTSKFCFPRCTERYVVQWSGRAWTGMKDVRGRGPCSPIKQFSDFNYSRVKRLGVRHVENMEVYNLETADHTYGVPFLVHNCNGFLQLRG